MSARNSGVKNFVSYGVSFVRALPVSQDQSANANGSLDCGFATPADLPFSVACVATAVTPTRAGVAFKPPAVSWPTVPAVVTVPATGVLAPTLVGGVAASADSVAAGRLLDSSSSTRFSSSSTRSSSQRSRSVNGAGASILGALLFAGAAFAGGLLVSLSSASKRLGKTLAHSSAANSIWNSLPSCLNARISL